MWVFGYGSLMWRPDFEYEEVHLARMFGAHRRLCIRSHIYRGSPEQPGLVLGLDYGGSCIGVAFRVAEPRIDEVREYLRAREMVNNTYKETYRNVHLHGEKAGDQVSALCYLVDRNHKQYAGHLPLHEQVEIVRRSKGSSGPNIDYVRNTCLHLRDMGIKDHQLEDILQKL